MRPLGRLRQVQSAAGQPCDCPAAGVGRRPDRTRALSRGPALAPCSCQGRDVSERRAQKSGQRSRRHASGRRVARARGGGGAAQAACTARGRGIYRGFACRDGLVRARGRLQPRRGRRPSTDVQAPTSKHRGGEHGAGRPYWRVQGRGRGRLRCEKRARDASPDRQLVFLVWQLSSAVLDWLRQACDDWLGPSQCSFAFRPA